jgi:hypothetical protein
MTRQWDGESAVRSVSFDRATHTLRVELEDGVYDFADVPERLYDELARSAMPDEFFREHIRDEFIATRAGDVDLAELAHERREDVLLGAPTGEDAGDVATDREVPLGSADSGYGTEHTWVIDVLDDDSVAVQIDGRQITSLPRWLLPADAHDGDVLRVTHARSAGRSSLSIELDRSGTRPLQRSAEQVREAPSSEA